MSAVLQTAPTPRSYPAVRSVAVAHGDGIGPEIMDAVLHVLAEAGAPLRLLPVTLGERAYRAGERAGIAPAAWEVIAEHGVLLKAPLTTPQGGGYKSVNVTLRKTLGLFANVRPCVAYAPYVASAHPGMDVVIVRENEEDTYGGIEHRQTDEVVQCLKLVSRPGCERIVRHAFDYALRNGRRKVTCMTKDNIMKLTDGLFRRVFEEVAADYPQLQSEHRIIDIGAARLATRPRDLDVVVTLNLYGDILSDIAAELAGSIGMAASANIGLHGAMFEAVHGSAPDIAGRDLANPSGLLQAAVMLLVHLGLPEEAARIHNAWLCTLEDGVHTADIAGPGTRRQVGTRAFAQAVAQRLGRRPQQLPAVAYARADAPAPTAAAAATAPVPAARKTCHGIDVFLHWDAPGRDPEALAARLQPLAGEAFRLAVITNRGVKVWPQGRPETFRTDHWRCRFLHRDGDASPQALAALLARIADAGLGWIKNEQLYAFDGQPGYSAAQGE